jgi:pyridoxamine 5'-phosphate oxidase
MNRDEMRAFMRANPNCCVASVDDDKPHTRVLTMYKLDDNGIVLQSDKRKDLYKQVLKNPQVEICFCDTTKYVEVRVNGRMEIVEDLALKKEIVESRPFEKPVIEKSGYDTIVVYRLKNGKATGWSFTTEVEPKTWVDL